MLQSTGLAYQYTGSPLLSFPDIHCEKGTHWLLLGQSGSGKTTLLHLLAGLRYPTKGTVKIGNTSIYDLSKSKLDQFRGQHIGIIFQRAHFIKALTVTENLALAQQLAGISTDKNRILNLLERLNIAHKANAKPSTLSVGEQQRAAIARAIVNRPTLILADEPTSALDDINCNQVIKLLEEQANEVNANLLVVTHDNRLTTQFANQIKL